MSFFKNMFGKNENKTELLNQTCEDLRQFAVGTQQAVSNQEVHYDDDYLLLFVFGAMTRLAKDRKLDQREISMQFFSTYLNTDEESVRKVFIRQQSVDLRISGFLHMSGGLAITQWLSDKKSAHALSEFSHDMDSVKKNGWI